TCLPGHLRRTERGLQLREITLLHQGRRNGGIDRRCFTAGQILHIEKEECFVSDDRSADGPAEMILAEVPAWHTAGAVEEGVGIEFVVADELPDIAVQGVGPALDGGIDNCSRRRAELCRIGACLDPELLQRIGGWLYCLRGTFLKIGQSRIIVDAV